MGLYKTGGGALSETVLWTNPSPTAEFSSTTVTLSDDVSNYKYIKVQVVASASSGATKYYLIIPTDDFIMSQSTAVYYALSAKISSSSNSYYYHRNFRSGSNTTAVIGQAYRQQTTGTTGNGYAVPLKIIGLK